MIIVYLFRSTRERAYARHPPPNPPSHLPTVRQSGGSRTYHLYEPVRKRKNYK